jgi:hypothetical protein
MVNLLSRKMLSRTGELESELPTVSEDAVKKNEQCDGEKSAAGEAMPSVAAAVSVVPVRAEVRAMEAVRVPERPEDKAENQRDCDEDEYGWDDDKGEHCVFSVQTALRETRRTGDIIFGEPGKSQAERASPFSRGFIAFTLAMRS